MTSLGRVQSKAQLKALQRVFAQIIRRPLEGKDLMRADKRTSLMIIPNEKLSAHERLELYAQQYWWRIRDSFFEDYPGVRRVVGTELFQKLAESYLVKFPSRSYTLRNLGSRFPMFLKTTKLLPRRIRKLAYEVACLEWDKMVVFDAPSGVSPSSDTPPNAKLILSPALRIRKLNFPAHQVFPGIQDSSDHEQTSNVVGKRRKGRKVATRLAVKPHTTYLATHRYKHRIYFKELSENEFKLLTKIAASRSLTSAIAAWRPRGLKPEEIPAAVSALFTEWGSLGWVCVKAV